MLTPYNRSVKQTESENTTLINQIIIWCLYISNNTFQDTQNLPDQKLKFPEIRAINHT